MAYIKLSGSKAMLRKLNSDVSPQIFHKIYLSITYKRSFLMPAKKKVDYKKLIKMVESGTHQNEIMKAFKFKTAALLKTTT